MIIVEDSNTLKAGYHGSKDFPIMRKIICGLAVLCVLQVNTAVAETLITPRLTLGAEYTDNLDRTESYPEEDYISTISPGVEIGVRAETASLSLSYDPAWVQYREHSDRDQWRHYGSLTGDWRPGRFTRIDFSHSLIISDDPADNEGTSTVTRASNRYTLNTSSIRANYRFGRENNIALGYNQSVLINELETIENNQRLNPDMELNWWFLEGRYGLTLTGSYTKADFQRSDDFDSYGGTLRLRKRITRTLDAFAQYEYVETEYEGDTENYKVHFPGIGFDYVAGEHTNVSMVLGYGIRERAVSEDDEGPMITGNAVTAWIYSRGSVDLRLESGYQQDTFSDENLGFYIYSGGEVRANYSFTRQIIGDVFGTYRYAKYLDAIPNFEDHVVTAGAGASYQALLWLRFRLEYAHRDFMSDDIDREYKENRIMLTAIISPSIPYRFN